MLSKPHVIVALVAAAATAAGAVFAAIALRGRGGEAQVAANESLLRVEAPAKVACSPTDKVTVSVYLDALTTTSTSASQRPDLGLEGWGITLRYDPKVLQVATPADVAVTRFGQAAEAALPGRGWFAAPAGIDNVAGWVSFSSFSVVSDQSRRLEPGLRPEAGKPLLLATVSFLTVGAGTSDITFDTAEAGRVALFPVSSNINDVEPLPGVRHQGATVAVEGTDCAKPLPTLPPTPTPRPAPDLSGPIPTRPAYPNAVAPDIAALAEVQAMDPCPAEYLRYHSKLLGATFCYPPSWELTLSDDRHVDFRLKREGRLIAGASIQVGGYRPTPLDCPEPGQLAAPAGKWAVCFHDTNSQWPLGMGGGRLIGLTVDANRGWWGVVDLPAVHPEDDPTSFDRTAQRDALAILASLQLDQPQ